jgi:hypothetical protein
VNLGDVAATPRIHDHLVRAGRRYRVVDVKDDGEGGAELRLHIG